MTLVEFLLARIAEDEAEARSLGAGEHSCSDYHGSLDDAFRWLAECDAKRRIIEWVSEDERPLADGHWEGHGSNERWVADFEHELLRLLALPYADHADYRVEWRP